MGAHLHQSPAPALVRQKILEIIDFKRLLS
jgi:hypothetical protein